MKNLYKFVIIAILIILIGIILFITDNKSNDISSIEIQEDLSICKSCYVVKTNIDNKILIDKKIEEDVLKQEIDFGNNTIFVYNPYGDNKRKINIYFLYENAVSVRYKLVSDNYENSKTILNNSNFKKYDRYDVTITDLVVNKINNITIELIDSNQNILDSENVIIDLSKAS